MDSTRYAELLSMTRRHFFSRTSTGIGAAALASLFSQDALLGETAERDPKTAALMGLPHFAPKAKRVIYLHQSGAPSQIDLFDYKPQLKKEHGKELPDSIRNGQRITGMTAGQSEFPVVSSLFEFSQHGQSGTWLSELLPYHDQIVDDIAIIKTVNTEAINHHPEIKLIKTSSQQPGRPSLHSCVSVAL